MKLKLFIALATLLLVLSSFEGYFRPILFVKSLLLLIMVGIIIYNFFKTKKENAPRAYTRLNKNIFILAVIFIVSVAFSDLSKAKANAVICPDTKPTYSAYYQQTEPNYTFDYDQYIGTLKSLTSFLPIVQDSIKHNEKYYSYFTIKHDVPNSKERLLIIASVHGDEPAGALSVLELINQLKNNSEAYKNKSIWILCPMNPIGLALSSRENNCGCNINRDYKNATLLETKHIVKTIKAYQPSLIIDLHENNGNFKTCLMANNHLGEPFGKEICDFLGSKNIELANYAFDKSLEIKGWHQRSNYKSIINKLAGLNDLMWYGESIKTPVLTIECDQSLPMNNRIDINLFAIKYIVDYQKQLK